MCARRWFRKYIISIYAAFGILASTPSLGWAADDIDDIKAEELLEKCEARVVELSEKFGRRVVETRTGTVSLEALREITSSRRVLQFVEENKSFTAIGAEDNAALNAIAYTVDTSSGLKLAQKGKGTFVHIALAVLKDINDKIFKQKNLPTALSNYYKKLLMQKISENKLLTSKIQNKSSDYKSIILRFESEDAEITAELEKVFAEANKEFAAKVKGLGLDPLFKGRRGFLGDAESWHFGGIADTADVADLRSRFGRLNYTEGGTPIQTADKVDGLIMAKADKLLASREFLAKSLPPRSGILGRDTTGGSLALSDLAINLLRDVKATDQQQYLALVKAKFAAVFKVKLEDDQVFHLRDFYANSSLFSLNPIQAKRVIPDLSKATHGVLTVDYVGQGARNVRKTMSELSANDLKNPATIAAAARRAEQEATKEMSLIDQEYQRILKDTFGDSGPNLFQQTGDEGSKPITLKDIAALPEAIKIPTERLASLPDSALKRLANRLAWAKVPGVFRNTYTSPTFADGTPLSETIFNLVASRGEQLVKDVSATLTTQVHIKDVKKYSIVVRMNPETQHTGTIRVFIGGSVSRDTLGQFREAFRKLVPKGYKIETVERVPLNFSRREHLSTKSSVYASH